MAENGIESARTPAGIPVVTVPKKGGMTSGYMVGVHTGSRDESTDVLGISHLLEHVVFRRTKTKDSYQMAKEIEGAGGELNAFTGREMTAYYGITLSETKDVAKGMVYDIVANPLLDEEDVELEKKIVLQELSMIENEPESHIHDLYSEFLWRGHKLSQDEGGKVDIVKGLGSEELKEYYNDRYGPPNMSVFAVGDVDLDDVVEWATNSFDDIPSKGKVIREPPKAPTSGYRFKENKSEHCHIALGFPGLHPDDALSPAASVLSAVLGYGSSSRLFQKVREEKALVYSIYMSNERHSDTSELSTYMSSTSSNVLESLEVTANVIRGFKAEGLVKGEMDRTKRMLKGTVVRSGESSARTLYSTGVEYMLTGKARTMEERISNMERVTEEDVVRAGEALLRHDRLNLVILGSGSRKIKNLDIESLDL